MGESDDGLADCNAAYQNRASLLQDGYAPMGQAANAVFGCDDGVKDDGRLKTPDSGGAGCGMRSTRPRWPGQANVVNAPVLGESARRGGLTSPAGWAISQSAGQIQDGGICSVTGENGGAIIPQ